MVLQVMPFQHKLANRWRQGLSDSANLKQTARNGKKKYKQPDK